MYIQSCKKHVRTAPLISEPISRKQQPVTGSVILPLMDYLTGAESHVAICYRKKNTAEYSLGRMIRDSYSAAKKG